MNWHSTPFEDIFEQSGTSPTGLTETEASKRLDERGRNKLDEGKTKGLFARFIGQFKNVMVIVLIAAALISAGVTVYEVISGEPDALQGFADVGIILAIVVINAVIGVIQESKAEAALTALKKMSEQYAKVKRGGIIRSIPIAEVAEGDIVILEAGDICPADVRLISSASLKAEESALTGESAAVEKSEKAVVSEAAGLGDRTNMVFSSSVVTYGRGEGVAVATGMRTEIGKIAAMLNAAKETLTPIQKKLDKTGKFISIAVLIIAAFIFVLGIVSALIAKSLSIDTGIAAFMTAVAIAVAAIPEGLTAVITIIMALGVQKMSRRNAIIRRLPAVETLGSTEVICSDKTGTLT
ncbi:MAG: HAD-IC family P-type ATPase, partial [Clostridiales bacterium]|nr:HAD-IC family P-type ATPase [Clostridiales bacterium]